MKFTCPNGHGSSDEFPICMTCEVPMIDNSVEAPKVVETVIVAEAPKEEEFVSKKKKK